jgi:GTP cyclohydrolase I
MVGPLKTRSQQFDDIAEEVEVLSRAAYHYKEFCRAVGIDITKPDTKDTPKRVAKMFLGEFTEGLRAKPFTFTTFKSAGKDLVCVCGVRFVSCCAHHHLPMYGYAHFCYLPDKTIAGLSKIPRLIKWASRQPSVQEDLTHHVLQEFVKVLKPHYAGLMLTAQHTCMSCRGINDHEARMTTTALYARGGNLNKYNAAKSEFLSAIDLWYKSRAAMA